MMYKYAVSAPYEVEEIIQKSIFDSIKSHFPIEGNKRILKLEEISINDPYDSQDYPLQKKIKLKGKSLMVPIKAKLSLIDKKTGEVIDSGTYTIGKVPKYTNRFTTIIDGNEYQTLSQFRLKSGVYTRQKDNGELESRFNLEKGYNFKIELDPDKGIFYITLANRHFPLYTLLTVLGVSDSEMEEAWGKKLFLINRTAGAGKETTTIPALYKSLTKEQVSYETAVKRLKEYFANTKISPDTTKITLGKSFSSVTPETLLLSSKKLLKVQRGEEPSDERDSLVFKDLYEVDDLLLQYFDKNSGPIINKLKRSIDIKDRLRDMISSDLYGAPIKTFFTTGDLSTTGTQVNPVEMLTEWRKTTIMGTGGIQSRHAITSDTRDVHPSQLGFLDPITTPDSFKVGITLPLSTGVYKKGKTIYTAVIPNNQKIANIESIDDYVEHKSPWDLWNSYVGFADEWDVKNGKVSAKNPTVKGYYKGKSGEFPKDKIDYFILSPDMMFSVSSNLIPFLQNTQGNRASMGSRMLGQAVSLVKREPPLVRTKSKFGTEWERFAGEFLQSKAPVDGVVEEVTDDYIIIKGDDGKKHKVGLYNYFPLNQESFLESIPKVKPGDRVFQHQVLTDNNFTKDNVLALGRNVNVAYMPWKGYNFEDGVVVTESFAKDFTSQINVKKTLNLTKRGFLDKKKFQNIFPLKLTAENAAKLNDDGLPKEGAKFYPNEIYAAYMETRDLNQTEELLKKMSKAVHTPFKDKSLVWDHEHPGVVKHVVKGNKQVTIYFKVEQPLIIGDKIAGRYGNKGIVTKIIPDEEAPYTESGERIDVIMSPAGVPGRINPSQLLETAAAKWAAKTGQVYDVENFDGKDHRFEILKKLKEAGIEPDETLYDGKTGKPFEQKVFTGKQYIIRLMHDIQHKIKARERGSYDLNLQPSSGKTGGQKIDPMLMYAMLGHGAKSNLRDATLIKGMQNDEVWRAIQLGLPIPYPKENFVFDKMVAHLKAAGVNVEKKGNTLITSPFLDKQTEEVSSGDLPNAGMMLISKNLAPIPGGLFDPDKVGGLSGSKWAHIELHQKMPHPLFENAIQKLTDISKPQYDKIMKEQLEEEGLTGPELIEKKLKSIDVDKELKLAKQKIKTAKAQEINKLNKKIRYLEALKANNLNPTDLMISKVPVLPAKFRPIFPLPSGDLRVSPLNYHYRNIALTANAIKSVKELGLDEKEFNKHNRQALYQQLKEYVGLVDPVQAQMKNKPGIIKFLAGTSPKTGLIQANVWSKRQDVSARSTITLEPSLHIDEAGLPYDIAKVIYKPFVVREFVNQGYSPIKALEEIKKETPIAKKVLESAMEKRPILLNRAPSLHKHSVQAFKPVLYSGKDIKLNPLIVTGFNADFDGDTMGVHLPVTDEAVREAWNMLPSKNIFKSGDFSVVPEISRQYQLGLYFMTEEGKETNKTFNSVEEAEKAGLHYTDMFTLKTPGGSRRTSIGREKANAVLPKKYRDYTVTFTDKYVNKLLEKIGKESPGEFGDTISKLKDLGNHYGFIRGQSLSLTDITYDPKIKENIIKKWEAKLPKDAPLEKKVETYMNAKKEVIEEIKKKYPQNRFFDWERSGALRKSHQVEQILAFPAFLTDIKGEVIPTPVTKNYGEGVDLASYWNSLYGARKGTVDRAVNTQDSGALNKRLLGVTRTLVVKEEDCGTDDGIEFEIDDKNVLDRCLAEDIPTVGEKNDIVDEDLIKRAKKQGLIKLKVRSPLTCETPAGVCKYCYGLMPDGQLPNIGEYVGILDGAAITERATQLTMKTFHTGGAVGTGSSIVSGFSRLKQLLNVPNILPSKATLAKVDGAVTSIRKAPAGGTEVYIGGIKHFIEPGLQPKVKVGDFVKKGNPISEGVIKPQELAELKDFREAQLYLVDEMDKIFDNKFFKKTFETVVRATTDWSEIIDPGDSDYLPGDRVRTSVLKKQNKELEQSGKKPITFKPYLKSIEMLPDDSDDWLDRLSNLHLKKAIQDMASEGMASDLHGQNPLPGYLYALEFNDPKKRKEGYLI